MPEIRKPAIKIEQGKRSLFLATFCVRDFMDGTLYTVKRLDVEAATGMQRLLNKTRARSFAKDMLSAEKYNQAFLPTSVFLATGGEIGYDEEKRELFFDTAKHANVCPLDLVDGQHRIEGLRMAVQENEDLRDFPISVIIAHKMGEADRMLQFVTVNTKQQAVNEGVAQHIIARFTKMLEVEKLPYLPSWLKTKAEKGSDAKALDIILYLNSEPSSPWHNRVTLSDQTKSKEHTINQTSFVNSVKEHIFSKGHPLSPFDGDRQKAILKNYWSAVREIFVEPGDDAITKTVVFKYNGLGFFHSILASVINHLAKERTYTKEAIKTCILSAGNYLGPNDEDVLSVEFWERGSIAGGMNKSAAAKRAHAFSMALGQAANDDIQL